jgi:hypothetical protein
MTWAGRRTAALLALVAGLLAGPLPVAGAADDRAGAATDADRVLVVGVPGLTWADVDPEATPELWALAEESAIGAVSVRTARSTTCLLDGWATLGAGNRARVPGPDEGLPPVPLPTVPLEGDPAAPTPAPTDPEGTPEPALDTTLSHCGLQERAAVVALADPAAVVQRTAADEGTARFGAEPGALGAVVGCATVSGRAATLAVAAPEVEITRADDLPSETADPGGVLTACPVALVSLDQLSDAGEPGPRKTDDGTEPALRAEALTEVDADVGRLRAAVAALPGDTLLILAGISEVNDGRSQLHVGMASGPGFSAPAWLSSPSTGRAPFAQLIDVAPTVLRALGHTVPPSMNGAPLQASGTRPALPAAVAELERLNTSATVHHRNTSAFFWSSVGLVAAVVALGMWVLGGALRGPAPVTSRRPGRPFLRTAAVAVAALPVATYLAGLAPWERAGTPPLALAVAVLAADAAVSAVALLGPWRRHRFGPPLTVLVVTFTTLVADVLTGSHLELDGLLGYDAIVAGRFIGYGNLSFGLLAVSALTVTAAAATVLGRRAGPDRARTVTAATVVGAGLLTVAVIGAPGLGRDFGGVLAALPGFLLLAMLLTRIRVTALRLVAVLAAGVLAVSAVAVLDWRRGPEARTHLGRFVEQVLTGEAWTVVSRKAQANLDILLGSPLAWMLPVAAVAAVWLLRPGGLLRRSAAGPDAAPAGLAAGDVDVLRAALLASLLSLAVGAAVNDSGVALPATAAALLVPLLVWLAAGTRGAGTGSRETEGRTPRPDPAEGAGRVTVVSRGSTVWNT